MLHSRPRPPRLELMLDLAKRILPSFRRENVEKTIVVPGASAPVPRSFVTSVVRLADESNIGMAKTASTTRTLSASFQEVYKYIEEITAATGRIQASAETLKSISETSKKDVNECAMNTLSGLSTQAQELGKAVSLVEDIAMETSILSLNDQSTAEFVKKSIDLAIQEISRLKSSIDSIHEATLANLENVTKSQRLLLNCNRDFKDLIKACKPSQVRLCISALGRF